MFDANRSTGRMAEVPIGKGSPYALQVFVAQRNGKPRPVVDMRPLNTLVPADSYPIPRQDEVLDAIGGHLFITSLDVTSSFYQRMIYKPDQYRTAVASHRGHEYFKVAVMGYKRSVQHNQRLFDRMFKTLLWRIVCVYIDDIFIYSNSFEDHVRDLDEVMQILSNKGFTLKARKAFIGYQSIEVLGRQVDRLGLSSTSEKTEAIKKIEFPINLKDLERFIGLASWNRHLIPFLAHRIAPLQRLKTKLLNERETRDQRARYVQRTTLEPMKKEVDSFGDVKEALIDSVRNYHFIKGRLLFIFLDASKAWGFGAGVYQSIATDGSTRRKDLRPICFISRQITGAESRYWLTDLELAGLVWAVKKL